MTWTPWTALAAVVVGTLALIGVVVVLAAVVLFLDAERTIRRDKARLRKEGKL